MKKFFRKLFGIKTPAEKAEAYVKNLLEIVTAIEKATGTKKYPGPERDDKGRWVDNKHPSARKYATLDLSKTEGCCGGEGCKCKKSNS